MFEIKSPKPIDLSPEQRQDLLLEIKRGLDRTNIRAMLEVEQAPSVRACPGCIACTCMIWI